MQPGWVCAACVMSLATCSRESPRATVATGSAAILAPAQSPGPGSAAPAPLLTRAMPSGPTIDLTHAVPITITVSSTVANPRIRPDHLVDGDLATAWNSRTDDAHAWISILVPPGVVIREVRMTAGFTAKGPNGEDYFTMNRRIRAVNTTTDDGSTDHINFDVASRALQMIPVVSLNRVRVTIGDTEPGSKPAWREVAVSELEVWGSPPPAWTAPPKPLVPTVRVVPTERATADGMAREITDVDGPCFDALVGRIGFEKDQREHPPKSTMYAADDHKYANECFEVGSTVAPATDPMWMAGIAYCSVNDRVYGPTDCTLPLRHGSIDGALVAEYSSAGAFASSFAIESVPHAGGSWLLAHLARAHGDAASPPRSDGEQTVVCRATPTIECSLPIDSAGSNWSAVTAIDGDDLVVTAAKGSADAGVVGRHKLVFSK